MSMKNILKRFWKEEDGLTVLEYVLGAAALAGIISATYFSGYGAALQAKLEAIIGT